MKIISLIGTMQLAQFQLSMHTFHVHYETSHWLQIQRTRFEMPDSIVILTTLVNSNLIGQHAKDKHFPTRNLAIENTLTRIQPGFSGVAVNI
ncbi:uncharacterized protein SPAPADRAFT_60868 [Spathaspora passalidarum NRRL Y-27907]|uniref:Uncharacterized protein n=1 Tax=Spathaspora passalidarum (strain NRRL Y-27907 / 11-Y1) TaxID=619300 RepID=G3AMS8_SPAPN|nr:uncharacterized protein SPAPADRAFT_60868 [Spathaspora passalidarum NRRL Y-27907]EGW33522.1 hypothetical protein SPAPADRAFT_60868 [Spathaspora passalidarum NRRL Y-27907]